MNEVTINKIGATEVYYSGHPIESTTMMIESRNAVVVVFTENIHGTLTILDMGATPKDRIDLEVDKWVKGVSAVYQCRFVKKVDNVYFYK